VCRRTGALRLFGWLLVRWIHPSPQPAPRTCAIGLHLRVSLAVSHTRTCRRNRTPFDQRVRVFVSSTLEELADERAAALGAIRRLHLVPVWFESGARPHPPQSMYRAYLEQSQIFVGIYWQRYGWVGPGMEISGLEDEFRLAAGKPMLLYLKRPAPEQEPGLTAMIEGIRSARGVLPPLRHGEGVGTAADR
jgi:hypothetical protein